MFLYTEQQPPLELPTCATDRHPSRGEKLVSLRPSRAAVRGSVTPRTLSGATSPVDVHGPYTAARRRCRRHRLQLLQQRLAAGAAAVLQARVRPHGGWQCGGSTSAVRG